MLFRSTRSTGLKAELENAGADEIIASIKDDTDKLEEVAKASFAKLAPNTVFNALTKRWTADQLRDLIKLVNAYLATQNIPPGLRRPLATAQPTSQN